MTIYYVLIFILLSLAALESNNYGDSKSRNLLFAALSFIWFIMAFRGENVGTDTHAYLAMYNYTVDPSSYHDYFDIPAEFEPGFYLLQVIMKRIGLDAQWLIYLTSGFYCLSLYCFLNKYSHNRVFCLFLLTTLGLFQFAISGMRQTIAIGILLFAFDAVLKRRIWVFLLFVLLAMQFHKSAFFALSIYFIAPIKVNKKNGLYLIVGLFAIVLFADNFLILTAEVMSYSRYLNIEQTDSGLPFFLVMAMISYLGYMTKDKIAPLDKTYLPMLNVNFITLSVWGARLVSRTAERVSYYFLPYTCVVLEKSLCSKGTANRELYIGITIVLSIALFIHRLNNGGFEYNFSF